MNYLAMKHWQGTAALAIAAAGLAGCTTMGGNVKGSFACSAPAGVCAPTSKIDDQALAMISGAEASPSGLIYPDVQAAPSIIPASGSGRLTRSTEKVLRIVFPAHVDRLGFYREASAVHAVVERGEWIAAPGGGSDNPLAMKATDAGGVPLPLVSAVAVADEGATLVGLAAGSPEVTFPDATPAPESVTLVQALPAPDAHAPSAAVVAAARRVGRRQRNRIAAGPGSATGGTPVVYNSQVPVVAVRGQASASAGLVSGSNARAAATGGAAASSPVQSIRDQVGAIFSAHPSPKVSVLAQAKPGTVERPANAPAVLSVSGVDQ